ncbi:MAG TPA: cation transporter [Solirubrobacteraceae bacterium]|nr:cation transporter [Solirubrobacteraceae bacterium]
MTIPAPFELPPDKLKLHRKARRLEWMTIAYLISATVLLYLTIGQSQAGKAAMIEDALSLTPAIAWLIAARFRDKPPDQQHPWGFHRGVTLAYLASAVALLLFGSFILIESTMKLVTAEHPPMGVVELFGEQIWLGWLMLPALAWSAIPAVFLGHAKMPLAAALHDKVLYADAKMNKADWMTATAAAVGVIGIGFGLWWADAVAAIAISLDIVRDGWTNLRAAGRDVIDTRPATYDGSEPHPLVGRIEETLRDLDWVQDAQARLREEGHVFTGEALVIPRDHDDLVERIEDAARRISDLDWRMYDIVVVPVSSLDKRPDAPEPQVTDVGSAPGRSR